MDAKLLQAKHLDESAILAFVRERHPQWLTHWRDFPNSIPDQGAPEKVLLAKLRSMERRGLIAGCGCGCRGDWRLPEGRK